MRRLEILRPIMEDEKICKVGQNIKYDLNVLANYGSYVVALERMLLEHLHSASGVKLLARLEEAKECALEISCAVHRLQHAKQYGSVHIVTTGVHNALTL